MIILDYIYITTPEQAALCANNIFGSNPSVLGVDTETTGLNCFFDQLRLVQIAMKDKPVCIIDICKTGITEVNSILSSASTLIFHNGKFDLKFLH